MVWGLSIGLSPSALQAASRDETFATGTLEPTQCRQCNSSEFLSTNFMRGTRKKQVENEPSLNSVHPWLGSPLPAVKGPGSSPFLQVWDSRSFHDLCWGPGLAASDLFYLVASDGPALFF